MNAHDVQRHLVCNKWKSPFYFLRQFVVLPNSNSFTSWEADLLVCSKAGFLTEIEIKVSRQDWRNDTKKDKFQNRPDGRRAYGWGFIKQFYYAVPREIAGDSDALVRMPQWAGLIAVSEDGTCEVAHQAETLDGHRKLSEKQLLKFARLAAVRIWT